MAKDDKDQGPRDERGRKLYPSLSLARQQEGLQQLYEADVEQRTQADKLEAILSHLQDLFGKGKGSIISPVQQSFVDWAADRSYDPKNIRILFKHASDTGRSEINGKYENLWHLYYDNFSKILPVFSKAKEEDQNRMAMDLIVYSKWNAHNFPKIMGFQVSESPPALFSQPEEITDFKTMVSYMAHRVVPALKSCLCERMGMDTDTLEDAIATHEDLRKRGEGLDVEILRPLDRWNVAPAYKR